MIPPDKISEKYISLVKVNEKLTQLHWIVAQISGENDLHTMYNLVLNGFMQIAEVPGCQFILLDEKGYAKEIIYRCIEGNPFCSCDAYHKVTSMINKMKNMDLILPHNDFCGECQGDCGLKRVQIISLYGRNSNPLAVICAQHYDLPLICEETQMILELFTMQVSLALENALLNKKFKNLSITDALTGLYNHRYFAEKLQKAITSCHCCGNKELCIIMLDVDKFKSYNDSYGHPAGDHVLKTIGNVLTQMARPKDLVARYGGEEFAFILPDTSLTEGIDLAEKVRQAIENTTFPFRPVTASMGIANYPIHTSDPQDLLKLADKALYNAKSNGRNRVMTASVPDW